MTAVAPQAETPLLAVNNVEVVYDHVILVLRGVSLELTRGQIVALLGANGAGKTTTLKAVSNLLEAERGAVTKGSITFDGARVDQLSPSALVRRGVIQVMEGRHCFGHLTVEAIRVAQGKFGKKPLTGEQVRWGLEHIKIDDARLAQLGAAGFIQPLNVSCADHEGGGAVKFQQWDGTKWKIISDWIQADKALVRPMIEESAMKYAKENNITPRDCSKEN